MSTKTPIEPEYVGAFSEPVADRCFERKGDFVEELEQCSNDATHTVVMRSPSGVLHEVAMCDECGEPEDAAKH